MIRLVLRAVGVRRLRALLTLLAVVLGVTLIAGTFIFTDTIRSAFAQVFVDATRGADAVVSGRAPLTASDSQPPSISERVLEKVRGLRDVERAEGQIVDRAALVRTNGTVVGGSGRTRALSYVGPPFQAIDVVKGRPPRSPNEVAVDEDTAVAEHYRLGQRVVVASELPKRAFRLVGLVRFGGTPRLGATLVVFDFPAAQQLFLKQGRVDEIDVAGRPGVAPAKLARAIAPLLGPQATVRTAAAQAKTETDRLANRLSFLTQALLAFGLIAVFVGAFVIFNSFSITVAQRTRELGLLRTLGAQRRQLLASVVSEALVIGALGSGLAIGLGFATAAAIRALFEAVALRLPATGAVLEPRTVYVCMGVGMATTLLAALAPALRATRVPPVAALREGVALPPSRLAPALPWAALALVVAGVGLTVEGIVVGADVGAAAGGAIALAVGIAMLSPRLVPSAARVAGWPLEWTGSLSGQIARGNAVRNPSRTAATAAALMIGLAVVVFVTVFAHEARAAIRDTVARSFAGDIAVTNEDGFSPIPAVAAQAVAAVPGVQTVTLLKRSDSRIEGTGRTSANGIDTQTLGSTYRFDWESGDDSLLGLLGPNGALVEHGLARRANLRVGSHFVASTPAGKQIELTVRGIYRDRALLPGYTLALTTFDDVFHQLRARRFLAKLWPGADAGQVQRLVNRALAPFPEARARSERQLKDEEAGHLNSVLYLFYALLGISMLVALFGLVNTLALSIHERTRELGTLRALGASRRAVRRIVRYESVITAAIGGALGLALGVFFAGVVTAALADEGFKFSVPWPSLAGLLALALALGVIAAIAPARRAARIDILAAIAHE
jgi:putative ABC transport system permease protein